MAAQSGYESITEQEQNDLLEQDVNLGLMQQCNADVGHVVDNIGFDSDYDRLHIDHPFLEINPPVGAVNLLFFPAANASDVMPVPNGAQLVRFKSTSNYYLSASTMTTPSADILDGSAPILNPEGWYYCKGKKSYSVRSTAANQVVTAEFFIQL